MVSFAFFGQGNLAYLKKKNKVWKEILCFYGNHLQYCVNSIKAYNSD